MNLTPGQVREVLRLSEETLRHWKRVLPPLRNRNGYRPCFTYGDLLALAVVKSLVEEVGLTVGALATVAEDLFTICNEIGWLSAQRAKLIVQPAAGKVELAQEQRTLKPFGTIIAVDLSGLVETLQQCLSTWHPVDSQQLLRFPPSRMQSGGRS